MLQLLFTVAAVLVICETDRLCVICVKVVVEVQGEVEVEVEGLKKIKTKLYFPKIYYILKFIH